MAETKNYVSKYSGDQLDAAIAVLGSLGNLFFSQSGFEEFKVKFNEAMGKLTSDVGTMTVRVDASINAANNVLEKANEAMNRANAASASVAEIASKSIVNYERIDGVNN